jgi:hypothetical protein
MSWVGPDSRNLSTRQVFDLAIPSSVLMTAKEKLRQAIEGLSEVEAEHTLEFITRRHDRDPMIEAFENAPEDDEPSTPEEDRSAAQAWEQRHDSISLDELERDLG